MSNLSWVFLGLFSFNAAFGQGVSYKEIRQFQQQRFKEGYCLDFLRAEDFPEFNLEDLQQIIIVRHGEPAMNKKGWRNREEAIIYTRMYDAVGVYDFDKKPICMRAYDVPVVYTSRLPRAINTAEKTINGEIPIMQMALFNEFERKIIKFPNLKLPMKFWSVTSRFVWVLGFNDKEIESFSEAKERSHEAASLLNQSAQRDGKALLFAHGFLNKYIKKYLKDLGYVALNLNGQQYLGAYYFYKFRTGE